MDKLYTCPEVAQRYGVQLVTVWSWIRHKRLPAIKIGRDYRISERDLQIFEEQGRTVSQP